MLQGTVADSTVILYSSMGGKPSSQRQQQQNETTDASTVKATTPTAVGTNGKHSDGQELQDPTGVDTVGELGSVPTSSNRRSRTSVGNVSRTSVTSMSSRNSRMSRDSVTSKRMSFYDIVDANDVNSYLLVGNQASANDEEFLHRKKVMFVMNLSNLPLGYIHPDIEYKNIPLEDEDDADLLKVLRTCLDTLVEWKQKCIKNKLRMLVYSFNGVSRSCAVILAHLMYEERLTLRQAWEHLKEKHPSAKPNDGFVLQLMQFEQQKLGRKLSITVADFYAK